MNNNWLNIEWDKNFSMWSTINNIVLGEANLSAENSGKPLRGQGSAPNPAGELWTLPRPPSWWGGGLMPLPRTPPHCRPRLSALRASFRSFTAVFIPQCLGVWIKYCIRVFCWVRLTIRQDGNNAVVVTISGVFRISQGGPPTLTHPYLAPYHRRPHVTWRVATCYHHKTSRREDRPGKNHCLWRQTEKRSPNVLVMGSTEVKVRLNLFRVYQYSVTAYES